MSEQKLGGWTSFNFDVSEDAMNIFSKALYGLTGVGYTPLAVATQVVSGMNYCFLCEAKGAYPNAQTYAAKVYFYQPLQGDPHITKIEEDHP